MVQREVEGEPQGVGLGWRVILSKFFFLEEREEMAEEGMAVLNFNRAIRMARHGA